MAPDARRGGSVGPILVVGALVLAVAASGLLMRSAAGGSGSSLDRGPKGTAALAGVIRRLGIEVESLRLGLLPLVRRPEGSVLVMPSEPGLIPSAAIGEPEVDILAGFMARGSAVLVAADHAGPLLDRWDVEYEQDAIDRPPRGEGPGRWVDALPLLPGPIEQGGPLAIAGRGGLAGGQDAQVHFAVGETPVVVSVPVGKGTLVVVSDPSTITNAGLQRGGNLEFWVGLVRWHLRPGGEVIFDDLHAGGGSDHGAIAWARRAGMVPALLVALVLLALYLWRAGSRLGSLLPTPDLRNPRASSELVYALAGLYQRAGLHAWAVAVVSRRFRRRIERRSGLPWDRNLLDPWVEKELGPDAARTFGRIRRGFAALLPDDAPDREQVLELARLVHRFEQAWLRPRGQGMPVSRQPPGSEAPATGADGRDPRRGAPPQRGTGGRADLASGRPAHRDEVRT